MQLDERQREIIQLPEGRFSIRAGAGAGKTTCLVGRINYLLERGESPFDILAVTFTRNAAQEMRERLDNPFVRTCTVHSWAYQMLKAELPRFKPELCPFDMLTGYKYTRTMKEAMRAASLENVDLKTISLMISRAKTKRQESTGDKLVDRVWENYEKAKQEKKQLDFDDLLILADKLLNESDVRNRYRMKWVLVDEAHDLSPLQHDIIQKIETGNILFIASPEQCIARGQQVTCLRFEGLEPTLYKKPIENVQVGDIVATAVGASKVGSSRVNRVKSRIHKGTIITIKTKKGRILKVTPEHLMFVNVDHTKFSGHYVYLMYDNRFGYRIGYSERPMWRLNHERADAIYILKKLQSEKEARLWELILSLKYRIPTIIFRNSAYFSKPEIQMLMEHVQPDIEGLARDLNFDLRYPTRIKSSNAAREDKQRFVINVCLADVSLKESRRKSFQEPFASTVPRHVVFVNSADENFAKTLRKSGFEVTCQTTKTGGKRRPIFSVSKRFRDFREAKKFAHELYATLSRIGDTYIIQKMRRMAVRNKYTREGIVMPASNLIEGMLLPVTNGTSLTWDEIVEIQKSNEEIEVFDLEVEGTHNFIVEDIAVHNCVYEFRQAEPKLILNLDKRYPDIREIKLERNYRSADEIVQAANNLISGSLTRSLMMKGTGRHGEVTYSGHFSNVDGEINYLLNAINSESCAILYRVRWYGLFVERYLRQEKIPYHVLNGKSFFDLPEIQDMIAYLKLSQADDPEAFLRIINHPTRYLGAKWKQQIEPLLGKMPLESLLERTYLSSNSRDLAIWRKGQKNLLTGLKLIRVAENPKEVISIVRKILGYDTWWAKECQIDFSSDEPMFETLDAFEQFAADFESVSDMLESIGHFEQDTSQGVSIGTVHAAKGLEWDEVHGVGITQGILPHSRSENYSEERRIFYVMLTRARKRFEATSASHKGHTSPSEFLAQLGI